MFLDNLEGQINQLRNYGLYEINVPGDMNLDLYKKMLTSLVTKIG